MVLAAAVLLNPLFEVGFKELVDRVRPSLDQLVSGNGPSFPSGHVLASVGFYGLLPFLTLKCSDRLFQEVHIARQGVNFTCEASVE